MNCPACEFESKYATKECPRPVPDLSIHTCGQVICPMCDGYTVINGAPIGGFTVIGGDPCSLCKATGRVTTSEDTAYVRPCYGHTEVKSAGGVAWLPCSLPLGHAAECK